MNKWFTALSILLIGLSTVFLHSQPQVSYIIPDIGAPAMNVYVEFISPYNEKGNFGDDAMYINNPDESEVRVITANPADAAKVKIGPVVVSWDGRLISTQVFVHPELQPNSTEALLLRPEFRIPLVVVVNGVRSNEQIFYIVRSRPYFDGVVHPTDLIFGEGALGLRSPRGAMIFDSIRLDNKTYTISKNDCDPNTDGNQGYLPFTLLVRGKLSGVGTSTMITADANGRNGGPGGGGGGGRFYDAFLFGGGNNGDDGGAGFVGGGAGGRNRNAMAGVSDAYKSPGVGTGAGSNSLNGVPFPSIQAYESAAGGTGHPFGISGTSCSNGNNCEPDGTYGAGSGVSQNRQGGAGGYANDGSGIGPSYGRKHGNIMNIPLAGGSGGAGGNPNWPDAYSGNGGGGGGAMTIFAYEISSVRFSAKGANGTNPSGGVGNVSYGGSGSGGALNILSKGTVEDVTINIDGGIANNRWGGKGRHRIDGKPFNNILETNDNSFIPEGYKGITTDTSQFVTRAFKLTGTQAMPGKFLSSSFYLAPFDGDWIELSGLGFTDPPNGEWEMDVIIPNERPYLCLVAMQSEPSNNRGEFDYEPIRILSQAGANFFILDVNPILVADSVAENMSITCIGHQKFIETVIKNDDEAGSDLIFNTSTASWTFGQNGFEVFEPLGEITLAPGEEIKLRVRYTPNDFDKTNISNRLEITHNDPAKRNPWYITFKVGDAFLPKMEFVGQPEDFIFPDTRIGGKSTRNLVLKNIGEADLRIEQNLPINPPFYIIGTDKTLPVILKQGEELRLIVEFRPTDESISKELLRSISILTDTTCSSFASQMLEGTGVFSSIDVNTEIDFGLVPWCYEIQDTIKINNPSPVDFQLMATPTIEGQNPEAFIIVNPEKEYPLKVTLGAGAHFYIKINGKNAGTGVKTAIFKIATDIPETPLIEVILKAEIIGFDVTTNQNPINLGNVDIGFDYVSTVTLRNNGRLPERIEKVTSNQPTRITIPSVDGTVISPNGGVFSFDVTLNTNNSPVNNILTIAFDDPCDDTIRIPYILNYVTAKESAFTDSQKLLTNPTVIDTIDFGKFSPCEGGLLKVIQFTNISEGRYLVLNEGLNNLGESVFFFVGTGLIYPDTIPPSPNPKGGAQLFFEPKDAVEGIYYAEYLVTIYINGETVQRKIILKGEVVEGDFDYTPQLSQMSAVVGLTDSNELTIKNNGPYIIEIIGFTEPADPAFIVQGNIDGIVIPVDGEIKFIVEFSPSDVIAYNDSIIVKIKLGGCEKEFVFYLEGQGMPSKKLNIFIPQMVVEPTLNNFKIPVYGKLEKPEDTLEDFVIESLKITMRRSMFYPQRIIGGTLINSSLAGDNRVIEFSINDINVSANDSILAEIEGATLLGDVDFTNIQISDITYSMRAIVGEITSNDGSMKTEICSEGGDRLLKISGTGSSVSINPNPATDLLSISTTTLEKGKHTIEITDLLGKTKKISEFVNPGIGDYEFSVSYPTSDLPSGNYILKLQTPTEVITLQIVILK